MQDMSNMLLNLPLDAIIVDCKDLRNLECPDKYRIMKAPENIDGIRRKRKLLTSVQGRQTPSQPLGAMVFMEIDPELMRKIVKHLLADALAD